MAEDMFDNGSFLRRRKRYKRPSFPGHWSTMLDPYTRKLLSQYTFQHMQANGGAASHGGGPPGALPQSAPHPPPLHHGSHMHPNLLPHPMLISGSNSHQPVGNSNPGQLSPTQHPHQGGLPMGVNMPSQNPIIPPHPMIAAAARAAQLANFPLRPPPPPPCSVSFSSSGSFPHSNFPSSVKSPKRPSPENSPLEQVGLSSPGMSNTMSSQFSSSFTSSKENEYISNAATTTSSSKSSRGSGFTIDNIIGDQRRNDTSNNNNMFRNGEDHYGEKEEVRLNPRNISSSIQGDIDKSETVSQYESDSTLREKEVIKVEKDDENPCPTASEKIDPDTNSSYKPNIYDEPQKLLKQIHSPSNLPSFLQCAMLGKMVANTHENENSNDLYQDKEKFKRTAVSPFHLKSTHYQDTMKEESWK